MKANIFLLFILTLSLKFYAQTVKESNDDWKIGMKFSFDNSSSSKTLSNSQYIGYSLEFDKINYSTGITVERKLSTKLSINSGLEYSNKDFSGTFFSNVGYFLTPPKPQSFELGFLQIPLNLKYEYKIKAFSLFAICGFTNSFRVTNQIEEHNYSPIFSYGTGFIILGGNKFIQNTYLLSGNIGLGLSYKINEDWIFELSSEYNKSFTELYENVFYDQKYTGIIIGIKKRL